MKKWAGFASFFLAAAFILPALIYLLGNLRDAFGVLAYDLADFLYGSVWAASLIVTVLALRERLGTHAPSRMSLALLFALLAAGAMVAVACIRSANRHYHLNHPELNLEMSTTVLVVWTTIVAGVTGAGKHFLGWMLVLVGSAGWTSRRLPPALCVLYFIAGAASLFAYLFTNLDELVVMQGAVVSLPGDSTVEV